MYMYKVDAEKLFKVVTKVPSERESIRGITNKLMLSQNHFLDNLDQLFWIYVIQILPSMYLLK